MRIYGFIFLILSAVDKYYVLYVDRIANIKKKLCKAYDVFDIFINLITRAASRRQVLCVYPHSIMFKIIIDKGEAWDNKQYM